MAWAPGRTLIGGHSVAMAGSALVLAVASSAALGLAFYRLADSADAGANIDPIEHADSASAAPPTNTRRATSAG
jgi:hypothetical protein